MNKAKLEKLEKMFNKYATEEPEQGFHTARQLGKMWGINERTASTRIKRCTEAGLIEVKNFKVKSGMVIRPIPHYRIK
jgi:predicted ArsR family transcriptional regulator